MPLFAVIDGLEGDLEAQEVHDRLEYLNESDPRAFLTSGMEFCCAALTHYSVSAKKITVGAGVFARMANQADKTWAEGKTFMMCPHLPVQVQATGPAPGGMDQGMMAMMRHMMTHQMQMTMTGAVPVAGAGVQGTQQGVNPADALNPQDPWEKKLNLCFQATSARLDVCRLVLVDRLHSTCRQLDVKMM